MTTFTFPYRRDAETTNLLDALEDLEAPAEVTLGPGADLQYADRIRNELAGSDLACWCPLDQPCHADVLLEIANRGEAT